MNSIVGIALKNGRVVFNFDNDYNSHDYLISKVTKKDDYDVHDYIRLLLFEKNGNLFISPSAKLLIDLGKDRFFELIKKIYTNSEREVIKHNRSLIQTINFDLNFISDPEIYDKYFFSVESDKFIQKLKSVLDQIDEEELKTIEDNLVESVIHEAVGLYFGWITPKGTIKVPPSNTFSHMQLLPSIYASEYEAMDDGYIRFIYDRVGLGLEASLNFISRYGKNTFLQIVKNGLNEIENGILTNKFGSNIPLPTTVYLEFFPNHLVNMVKADFDLFPVVLKNKLDQMNF